MLRNVPSRQALVCMFLAMLELVRLQAIQVKQITCSAKCWCASIRTLKK